MVALATVVTIKSSSQTHTYRQTVVCIDCESYPETHELADLWLQWLQESLKDMHVQKEAGRPLVAGLAVFPITQRREHRDIANIIYLKL